MILPAIPGCRLRDLSAFALNDAGYGLIPLLAGFHAAPLPRATMRRAAWFATPVRASTVLFSALIFWVVLRPGTPRVFPAVPFSLLRLPGRFFSVALAIGVVQILFGMPLQVVMITFYARLPLLVRRAPGWFIVVLSGESGRGCRYSDPAWAIPHSRGFCRRFSMRR